ncbi:MAG TPA: hypothetical protein VD866_01085 [Urbifossiella sp.]|nr:hypothetical protein [Urbifossiella sp.]
MSDAARLMDVARGVAAHVQGIWNPAGPDLVHAAWMERFTLNVNTPDTLLTGRRVCAIPALHELVALDRGHWKNRYTLGIILVERYAVVGGGVPPDDWIGERAYWWEQKILFPLCNPELVIDGPAGKVAGVMPDPETPPEVTDYLDRDKLTDHKLLYIAANFTFIDVSDHTGAG